MTIDELEKLEQAATLELETALREGGPQSFPRRRELEEACVAMAPALIRAVKAAKAFKDIETAGGDSHDAYIGLCDALEELEAE